MTMLRRFGGPEARTRPALPRPVRSPQRPGRLVDPGRLPGHPDHRLLHGRCPDRRHRRSVGRSGRRSATPSGWRWRRSGMAGPARAAPRAVVVPSGAGAGLDRLPAVLEAAPHRGGPGQHLLPLAGAEGRPPFIDIEKAFEQDPPPIGLSKLDDLTWKDRLDVQACTECTRCEIACPAARTGKALSPMLLILDLRNQLLKGAAPPPLARVRKARGDDSDAAGQRHRDGQGRSGRRRRPGALPIHALSANAEGERSRHRTAAAAPRTAAGSPTADAAPAFSLSATSSPTPSSGTARPAGPAWRRARS